MTKISESDIEKEAIKLLKEQGYTYLSVENQIAERESLKEVVLKNRLSAAIDKHNPSIPTEAKEEALKQVLNLPYTTLIENNQAFYSFFSNGIPVEYQQKGETVGKKVFLIDFEKPLKNDLLVCDQFTVVHNNITKRLDIVLFVNGLPLVVIELKSPTRKEATITRAFTQLQNYKESIPHLFHYNGVLVVSDGLNTKVGSLTTEWKHFMEWKMIDGIKKGKDASLQMDTLIKGMLRPDVLLDLIKFFTVFENTSKKDLKTGLVSKQTIKKIARYHQYNAVNKAVASTIRATAEEEQGAIEENPMEYGLLTIKGQPKGDKKIGVVWHTQGSGKSLSMLFYASKLIAHPKMKNPTIVVTDRNDLDNQLFSTFVGKVV